MLRAPFAIYPAVLAACVLAAGCSSTPEDKTAGWTTDRIYSEAREELSGGSYDKAVPLLEKLEGRAAGPPLAQQAQLEKAPAGSNFFHTFYGPNGNEVREIYQVNADRTVSLVSRVSVDD